MEDSPIVDTIIPVYNGEEFILQAIKSVENQTLLPNQIIIVNDGSTDNTTKLILDYKVHSKVPIKYVNKKNGGLSSARNAGIKASSGEFIAFLDVDDLWERNKLALQMKAFKESSLPNLGVVYTDCVYVDSKNNPNPHLKHVQFSKNLRGYIRPQLFYGNRISGSGSGVLVRRECFNKVGPFDEKLPSYEDWDMWIRISQFYTFDNVNQKLVRIRQHSSNMSSSLRLMILGQLLVLNKIIEENQLDQKIILGVRYLILRQLISELPSLKFYTEVKSYASKRLLKKIYTNIFLFFFSAIYFKIYLKPKYYQ